MVNGFVSHTTNPDSSKWTRFLSKIGEVRMIFCFQFE